MSRPWITACAALILLIVALAYRPGLNSGFIFDDAANLPALGETGPIDNGAALARYLTSGKADPTGRPVALLTFLIDARDWPADPGPFKRTNLIIHLINSLLLLVTLRMLGEAMHITSYRRDVGAVVGTLLWAVHPLLASTVLYAVQREAMLPATFTLLAMLCWLRGRNAALAERGHGRVWLLLGVGACTTLGFLAKANGILAPLLILIAEATLPTRDGKANMAYRRVVWLAYGPVAALIVGWLAWLALSSIGNGPIPLRGWSTGQRLLTEPTILVDYLRQWLLLKPIDGSLFHDRYPAATGWFSPWWTTPLIALCIGAIIAAFVARKRAPALSLAVLFFFGGHLLESTSVSLELYFEHRNYLPALLAFWPAGLAISRLGRGAAFTLGGVIAVALATLTHFQARLWAEPLQQALSWAAAQPDSPRAQAYAAQVEADSNMWPQALQRIRRASSRTNGEPQIAFTLLDIGCATGTLRPADIDLTRNTLATTARDPGILLSQWFERALARTTNSACPLLDRTTLASLLDAAASNPRVAELPGRRQDIAHLRGEFSLANGDPDAASYWFSAALREIPNAAVALSQAAALGRAGFPDLAVRHLDEFEQSEAAVKTEPPGGMRRIHEWVLERQGYWPNELAHLRRALEADVNRKAR